MSLFAYLLSGEWTEKTFQKLKSFFWLSGCSGHAPFKSGGEKIFQPAKSFFSHIQTYCCGPTAFGWGLGWLNAPWLCEWWCSYTWDGHGMVMVVSTGNIPKGGSRGLKALPSVTAPALANPWHASAMRPSPQPNAVVEEIYKKHFSQADFFPSGPDRSIATATNQPEKTVQPLKSLFFWKSTTVYVLGKGTSPVIPQSRINEARWNVAHTN